METIEVVVGFWVETFMAEIHITKDNQVSAKRRSVSLPFRLISHCTGKAHQNEHVAEQASGSVSAR